MSRPSLPTGTVTFLFTDIEGSTRLVETLQGRWSAVLDTHDSLVGEAIEGRGGIVVNTEGDAVFAVFPSALDGVLATVDAQRALARGDWPDGVSVRVRMGLHTGQGTLGARDYIGLDVHRAARVAASGHGGQIVLSQATAALAERDLPHDVGLRDLGKHRLKDLTEPETLFDLEISGLADEFPQLRTLEAVPNNLPTQVTSFVGRRHELDEVRRLLETKHVVTLTGPGGTGKTRLAIQVGAESSDDFGDGVFFADLSPIAGSDVVPSQILDAIGVTGSQGDAAPNEVLVKHMAGMQILLIVDNFEHVVEAAPLISELVKSAPRSRFLVTSRSPLRISGEQTYPVEPMTVRTDSASPGLSEAIELFEERARSVRPGFEVTPGNQSAVARLVERLDGLPLAIELVASRVRLLSVETILARLDAKMVGSGPVDLPERQRTLDGAIGWSHDLLGDAEQRLFARLSVFAGPARVLELEKVCGDGIEIEVLDGLEALADQSLIRIVADEAEPRYGMLHVIREYAARRLGESEEEGEIRARHLDVYTALAEEASAHLQGADRREWLNRLAAAHDNLRAASDWALETGEVDEIRRLSSSVWRFWQARGHLHEARGRLQTAVDLPGGDPALRAKALEALGGVLWWQGKSEDCLAAYEEAVTLQREVGEPSDIANALYNHALALGFTGAEDSVERRDALAALEEAQAIYQDADDFNGLGNTSWGRGLILGLIGGDDEMGLLEWKRSIDYYRQAGNEFGMGWALFELAWLHRRRHEPESAWPYVRSGLELFAHHHDVSAVVLFIAIATGVASDLGDEERAARLGGAFHAQRQSAGSEIMDHEATRVEELADERLEALSGDLRDAYVEGADMSFEEAVAYTLAGPTDD
jgi:predicted ATPase/class 3 adenylate cyclase